MAAPLSPHRSPPSSRTCNTFNHGTCTSHHHPRLRKSRQPLQLRFTMNEPPQFSHLPPRTNCSAATVTTCDPDLDADHHYHARRRRTSSNVQSPCRRNLATTRSAAATKGERNHGGRNHNSEERKCAATCQPLIGQSKLVKSGQLVNRTVNSGQNCKNGQIRGAELKIGQKLSC